MYARLIFLFLVMFIGFSEGFHKVLNITIFTEKQRENNIKAVVQNFSNSSFSAIFNVHVYSIQENRSDIMSLLEHFSKMDFVNSFSFVIMDLDISFWFIELLLRETTTLVFDIRNTCFNSQEKLPSNIVIMKPSLEEQEKVIRHLFQRLHFKDIEEFDNCFDPTTTSKEHLNPLTIHRRLHQIKTKHSRVIHLKCREKISEIFKEAKNLALSNNSYKWVIPELVGNVTSFFPDNVMALGLRYSSDVINVKRPDYISYLQDSLVIITSLVEEQKEILLGKCNKFTRKFVTRFISNKKFQGHSRTIKINKQLIRTNPSYEIYEIVTILGHRRWLSVGSWSDGKIRSIFMQHNGDNSLPQVLRVVTYYGKPWVSHASVQTKSDGKCLVGHLCHNYTNQNTSTLSNNTSQSFCCSGFMIDVLVKLEAMLKVTAHVHFVKDRKFGMLVHNGSSRKWNGMIGELERGDADIALHLLTITAERLKVVAFSQPYMEASLGILVSSLPFSRSIWDFVFLDTFSVGVWVCICVMCCAVAIVMWLAERLRVRRRSLRKPHKYHRVFNFSEAVTYTWSLAFQKAAEEIGPTSLAGRVLAGLFASCAIITCSSFTANLAAIKVTEKRTISISGIHDSKFQNPSEKFKFSILSDSAGLDYFFDNTDPAMNAMAPYLQRNAINNISDASEKLQSRKIHAFISDIPVLKTLAFETNCDLQLVGEPFFFSGYGLVYSKNFTWRHQFSLAVLQLQEQGFFENLVKKWIPQHCFISEKPLGAERLGMNEIGGSFLFLILGSLLGGILLTAEYCVYRLYHI